MNLKYIQLSEPPLKVNLKYIHPFWSLLNLSLNNVQTSQPHVESQLTVRTNHIQLSHSYLKTSQIEFQLLLTI